MNKKKIASIIDTLIVSFMVILWVLWVVNVKILKDDTAIIVIWFFFGYSLRLALSNDN